MITIENRQTKEQVKFLGMWASPKGFIAHSISDCISDIDHHFTPRGFTLDGYFRWTPKRPWRIITRGAPPPNG